MPILSIYRRLIMAAALALAAPGAVYAQDAPIAVFLDCDDCFDDYLRQTIDIVQYVRDPDAADVHVIITRSTTASGGTERAASFVGRRRFEGVDYLTRAVTEAGDTDVMERERLAAAVTIGLLTYLARDGVRADLEVSASTPSPVVAASRTSDPWRQWVVSLRGSTSFEAEQTSREARVNAAVGADRITDASKMTFGLELEYERQRFDIDEEDPLVAIRRERTFDTLIVGSLGAHWSAGVRASVGASTFDNIALSYRAAPAIEYNVFPYAAYTRRQLRINYSLGPYHARYEEETLFDRTAETLLQQELGVTLEQREPWGSIEASALVSNYLPGLSRYRVEVEGEVSLRLARGLSLDIETRASRLRDQVNLPRRGATPEEVLLELRELGTGYEYELDVGLSFTFGSIFSAIVNPRFGQ